MRAEHTALLYYYSSRWFLCSNVLHDAFELHQEIHTRLEGESHENVRYIAELGFLLKLAYLCGIRDKLNAFNLYL